MSHDKPCSAAAVRNTKQNFGRGQQKEQSTRERCFKLYMNNIYSNLYSKNFEIYEKLACSKMYVFHTTFDGFKYDIGKPHWNVKNSVM